MGIFEQTLELKDTPEEFYLKINGTKVVPTKYTFTNNGRDEAVELNVTLPFPNDRVNVEILKKQENIIEHEKTTPAGTEVVVGIPLSKISIDCFSSQMKLEKLIAENPQKGKTWIENSIKENSELYRVKILFE